MKLVNNRSLNFTSTVENKYNGQQVQWTFEIGTQNFFFGEEFLTTRKISPSTI